MPMNGCRRAKVETGSQLKSKTFQNCLGIDQMTTTMTKTRMTGTMMQMTWTTGTMKMTMTTGKKMTTSFYLAEKMSTDMNGTDGTVMNIPLSSNGTQTLMKAPSIGISTVFGTKKIWLNLTQQMSTNSYGISLMAPGMKAQTKEKMKETTIPQAAAGKNNIKLSISPNF